MDTGKVNKVVVQISQPCPVEIWIAVLEAANDKAGDNWDTKISTTEENTILTLTKK